MARWRGSAKQSFEIALQQDRMAADVLFQPFDLKGLKLPNRVFVSPDVGNVKRAQVYANQLGGEICIIDKRRKSGSETEAVHVIGDVEGKNVIGCGSVDRASRA